MFLEDEIKDKIVKFINDEFKVNFIYLFGSFARGEGREDSDIDLAIHGESYFNQYELFTKANELSFIVKRDVQLIDLRDVSTVFAAQIVGNNEVLFSNDENTRIAYNIRAFKDYVKLNEERQVILDAIKRDNDVIYNKINIIERCRIRIKEVYDNNPQNLEDYTKQDSIILNIQRAVEACIDISMHIVSKRKLGIPQNSRDAFEVMHDNSLLSHKLLKNIKGMIGFRNIAVHNYQKLNLKVIEQVIENHLVDFEEFISEIIKVI